MKTKCMFKCVSVAALENNYQQIRLTPDYSKDNSDFNKYTPTGSFEMTVSPEAKANGMFVPGKTYSIILEESE